ncbi:MAG TPA: response regulator [Bacteroidota bacterium]|nr:response regulator [Bacteroidota bacterium]
MVQGKPLKHRRTILFIDDESAWLEAIQLAVTDKSVKIMTAASGEEALQKIHRRKPDLILSDVRMPFMNGFDLFEKIRSNPQYRAVPYVFMSSIDDFDAKHTAKKLGADGYIEKPYDLEGIKRVLLELLLRFKTT